MPRSVITDPDIIVVLFFSSFNICSSCATIKGCGAFSNYEKFLVNKSSMCSCLARVQTNVLEPKKL